MHEFTVFPSHFYGLFLKITNSTISYNHNQSIKADKKLAKKKDKMYTTVHILNIAQHFLCWKDFHFLYKKSASIGTINQSQTSFPFPIRTRQNGNSIELGHAGTLRGTKLDYSLTEIPEP